jgi:hypothetical protein
LKEGRTVFRLALDAKQWVVLDVLLQHRICRTVSQKTIAEEILEKCPASLKSRFWNLLPNVPILNFVVAFTESCVRLELAWVELDHLVNTHLCVDARERTLSALNGLDRRLVLEALASLEQSEVIPVGDQTVFEKWNRCCYCWLSKFIWLLHFWKQVAARWRRCSVCID